MLDWLARLLTLAVVRGRWPEVLAGGYTALIPKPGNEGPLCTESLTMPSVVYRLWAGTGLWEVCAGRRPRPTRRSMGSARPARR